MARKRKNASKEKASRIVVNYTETGGTSVRVEHALSPEHAVWMLSQAIGIIVTQGGKEESADEPVSELPDADGENQEEDVSKLPN